MTPTLQQKIVDEYMPKEMVYHSSLPLTSEDKGKIEGWNDCRNRIVNSLPKIIEMVREEVLSQLPPYVRSDFEMEEHYRNNPPSGE